MQRFLVTNLVLGALLFTGALLATNVAWAADCPAGLTPPCTRTDYNDGTGGYQISGRNAQGGRSVIQFNAQNQPVSQRTPPSSAPASAQTNTGSPGGTATSNSSGCEGQNYLPGCPGYLNGLGTPITGEGKTSTGKEAAQACASVNDGVGISNSICYAIMYSFLWLFNAQNIAYWLTFVTFLILQIAQIFLSFAVFWFDGSMYYMVILMGAYVNARESLEGLQVAWGLLRDTANIMIIGGFVAVGISTILQIGQYAADKFLVKLIIAALLVNFSYFFAGAFIDGTNYVATQIYNSDLFSNETCNAYDPQQKTVRGTGTASYAVLGNAFGFASDQYICGIAASLMKKTNMQTWDQVSHMARASVGLNSTENSTATDAQVRAALAALAAKQPLGNGQTPDDARQQLETNYYFNLLLISVMAIIFVALMAYTLMQAAFMLIVRFVALIFLLVTSPIGIAGINVPFVNSFAGRWWSAIFSQGLFAPIYLFFLAVSIKIIDAFRTLWLKDGGSFAEATMAIQNTAGQGWFVSFLPVFMVYFVAIACLWLAYQFSKQIADSVPELKGLYDLAGKQATSMLMNPLRLVQAPVKMGLPNMTDSLAARGGALSAFRYASMGLRMFGDLGSQKKREKSVAEETNETVDQLMFNRFNKNDEKAARGGWWKRAPFSDRWTPGMLGQGGGALGILMRARQKGDERDAKEILGEELYNSLKSDAEGLDEKTALQKYGPEGLKLLAENGVLTPEQIKKIRESGGYSDKQKSEITRGYFKDFEGMMNNQNWAAAAKEFENMSDIERDILLAERKEIRQNAEFLAQLKSDTFKSTLKGQSTGEQDDAKKARRRGQMANLGGADGGSYSKSRAQETLRLMSGDEKASLDLKTVKRLADDGALTSADARHIGTHSEDEEIRNYLKSHEKYKTEFQVGPGVPKPEDKK